MALIKSLIRFVLTLALGPSPNYPPLDVLAPPPLKRAADLEDVFEVAGNKTPTVREQVLAFIQGQRGDDLTVEQISALTGIGQNTIRPRVLELYSAGLIKRYDKAGVTRSGRSADTYYVSI